MLVRELLTRLNFSVNDNKLKSYERSIGNIKTQADSAANAFRGMFAAFVGFQGLQALANTADQMQSLQARIGMLPQTVTDSGDAFDDVASRATSARQSIDAYASLYVKLQNAGKDFIKTQEEGLQITDTLSKALVVGGATAQEQSSAMLQFAQAIGSGVLQGDELRAMGEAAPQFMDELAKAIGIPRAELKKFASQGNLTSKMVIDAVKKMSNVFDDKFKQMPMTIGQSITIVKNRWDVFVNKLNQKSEAVTSVSSFLLKGFDLIESGLNKIFDFFGGATQAVKFFGIALAAIALPIALPLGFKMLVGFITTLLSPVGLLVAGLVLVGLAIEDVYQWATGGKSISGALFGDFDAATKPIFDFIDKVRGYLKGTALGELLFGDFNKSLESLKGKTQSFFGFFTRFFRGSLEGTSLGELFFGDFDTAIESFKSKAQSFFYFFSEAWGYISRTAEFFANIIPFDAIASGLAYIFNGVIYILSGVIDVIKGAFKVLWGILTGDFDLIWSGVENIFSGLKDIIFGVGKALIGAMVVATATLWTMLVTLFTAVKNLIVDSIVGGIVKAIKAVVNTIWDNIVELFTSVKSFIFDSISGGVVSAIKKRFDALEAAPDFYFAKTNAVQPMLINTTPSTVANTYRGITNSSNYAPQQNITINQTLPAGSTVEVAAAAKTATKRAIYESPMDVMARQVGQAQ